MWDTIDAYCERTSATLWAEPVNAITNLAFILAAWVMWRRSAGLPVARALCVVLATIGVGSGLYHIFANGLTASLDVAPILIFILIYVFAAARDFLGLQGWRPWAMVAGFVPYAAVIVPLFSTLRVLGSSAAYAPVPVLIVGFTVVLWHKAPATAWGLALGAAIFIVSLIFRTIDMPVCAGFPLGTHFIWHLLNAAMLEVMIEVYCRHLRAAQGKGS